MNIFLYTIIFIIGTLCGSFLTLATYRIPLHKDITHERSFCPNCNHKLSFLDLIPVLSYLFLRGKCRYCKKRISPKYLLFEVFTGLSFVAIGYCLGIDIYSLTPGQIIEFFIYALYIVFLLLIAGIDSKNIKIEKSTIIFGVVIAIINVIYQYISCLMDGSRYNLNRIILYLVFIIILLIVNIESIKKTKKFDYCIDLILITVVISLLTYEITTILSIIGCFIIIVLKNSIFLLLKKDKKNIKKLPIAYYLISSHFIVLVISYFYTLNIH